MNSLSRSDAPASVDTTRPLYRRDQLVRLLHPRSVAIVGVSPRPGTFGLRTLANLAPFEGRVDLVNGKYERIGELACHPSIAALPEVPDCVAVVVNQAAVEDVVAQCIDCGVGGVIVYASDYAETGNPEKIALQARLVDRVAGTSTRLLGPNCLGMNNYVCKARVTFGRMPAPRPLGRMSIGLVAQSGALGMALAQAVEHGVSVSHSFTAGNASDVGIADLVGYLAEDPACQVIACLFEGVPEPRRLIAAAERARQHDKPLIFYKMATGTEGAAAALSHTGTLAGSDAVYRAALSRAGAVFVDEFEDLVETAVFFGKAGRPRARGAVVIVSSGGAGVMAADKAEARGVAMPQPTGATLAVLEREIPATSPRR